MTPQTNFGYIILTFIVGCAASPRGVSTGSSAAVTLDSSLDAGSGSRNTALGPIEVGEEDGFRDSQRILRYRELFTGMLPGRTIVETWTLFLRKSGSFQIERDRGEASLNSLRVGVAKPLGLVALDSHDVFTGTWTGDLTKAIVLNVRVGPFDGSTPSVSSVHCAASRIKVLHAGAQLIVPPNIHAPWKPSERKSVDVLECERALLAQAAQWSDEPQPAGIPFAELPGIEYAHDNDDMVIQQGGVRSISPSP